MRTSGLLYSLLASASSSLASPAQQLWGQSPLEVPSLAIHSSLPLSHDLIGLHRNLTSIESISYNELEVSKWLQSALKAQGYSTELQEVEKDRYNVLAWPGKERNAKLLITSHIDTVGTKLDQSRYTR